MINRSVHVERIGAERVNLALAIQLQYVGFSSWSHELPNRSPDEIGHVFGMHDGKRVLEAIDRYKNIARKGALVVASTGGSVTPVGYVAVEHDVSGKIAERFIKRHFRPEKVYAKITNVAVTEAFRGRQLEHRLIDTAFQYFDPEQVPTTYIYGEDETSRQFFEELGFIRTPADQQPRKVTPFGEGSKPAEEWRYAAPSVEDVRTAINKTMSF